MVLMLTAADSPSDRVAGLGIGADDYLSKPFHFPELVLRIRGLARRKPTAQLASCARGYRTRPAPPGSHPSGRDENSRLRSTGCWRP